MTFFIHTVDSAVRLWHRPSPTHGLFVCLILLKICSKRLGLYLLLASTQFPKTTPPQVMLILLQIFSNIYKIQNFIPVSSATHYVLSGMNRSAFQLSQGYFSVYFHLK
jgi:hypothetical protein